MVQFTLIHKRDKRGQGWGLDLFSAITIFIIAAIILYVYAINYTNQSQNIIDEMTYEATLASELILSEDDFGILTNGKVNQSKLNDFNSSYLVRKAFFGLRNDFYFTMDDLEIEGSSTQAAGRLNQSQVSDLVKVTRVTIYKNKPTKLEVYTYKE